MAEEKISKALENLTEKVKVLERNNESLQKELSQFKIENWNLNQENERLRQDVEKWKNIAFSEPKK